MSYFRMCVLFCQEENRRFQTLENHPLVTLIEQTIVQAKTYRTGSVSFLALPAQHPKALRFARSQSERYG